VNKLFISAAVFLTGLALLTGCRAKKQPPRFFPVKEYILQQIHLVDSTNPVIYKITAENNRTDTTVITKQQFKQLAQAFTQYDINDRSIHASYKENVFVDGSTASLTFSYTTADKELPLQAEDVLLDTATQQAKWVFITKTTTQGVQTVVEKDGWRNNGHFFINRMVTDGDSTHTQQNTIVWKFAP
jgi:hypothetical protein